MGHGLAGKDQIVSESSASQKLTIRSDDVRMARDSSGNPNGYDGTRVF
jgi:hypothetical protein